MNMYANFSRTTTAFTSCSFLNPEMSATTSKERRTSYSRLISCLYRPVKYTVPSFTAAFPIGGYITEKRLFAARTFIQSGAQ